MKPAVRIYRICPAAQNTALAAFGGKGAEKFGGRWNPAGVRVAYASDSLALACLETLVHITPYPRTFPLSLYYYADIPDRVIERPATLPHGWNAPTGGADTKEFGARFAAEMRSVVLAVPSAILPVGVNFVVNPLHPGFDPATIKGPFPFVFDSRL